MNEFMAKVKKYFSSNFGKLSLVIMGISFVLTFLFSTLLRNRIDVSIIRAFISTVITGIILYTLAIVLKKFLSDVIESSGVFDNNVSNNEADVNTEAVKENIDDNNIIENNNSENPITDSFEMNKADNNFTENSMSDNNIMPSIDNINIDKNKKVDYHNTGDIGDIISSVTNNSNTEDVSDYFPLKKESADAVSLEREVKEDPEKVAKAVRTMLAKEEKKESK
ncbi:hypothetical protein [Brachyspira pilosicoli]|uniref:Uncharacterized protein n=1 Tax=Brachyspira pilosicoli TaxID=52584 RepID=A0AAJ6GET9_BRAPL|nr:hypothetical protein [Brachyspira pilosicoli]WIH81666.1 hypothetical protein NEI04_01515 [Brachyspira pilosicoli]WIH91058.1 hypothetical protein NEI02_03620 [Brachyspira pilosicoli]WIH93349.1 hypothetical protein NEI01_03620 [Brachyspira pilosicoli]WIH95639.1 hypothetical protein NEH99_03615 [Brachyspira pilosicoli]